MKKLGRTRLVTAKHLHLVGFAEIGEHRIAGAAADIAADGERDRAFGFAQMRHAHETRAQECVGCRTVDDGRARLGETRTFAVRQVDPMSEQTLLRQKPEAVIDVGVVDRVGKQLFHQCDLAQAFGKMRLHEGAGKAFQQLA